MKVGARLSIFNWKMRARRAELGLTQKNLADLTGMKQNQISSIEILKQPGGDWLTKLEAISDHLDMEFCDLFPEDYIRALLNSRLRCGVGPPIIAKEVELTHLLEQHDNPLLTSTIEKDVEQIQSKELAKKKVSEFFETLTPRQRVVIKMRYGLEGHDSMTLSEVGQALNLSRERIRQIEIAALEYMRTGEKPLSVYFKQTMDSKTLADYLGTIDKQTVKV